MTPHPLTREYFQSAFVVENLEAACHQWSNNFGIGPFFVKDYQPGTFDEVTYRGAPADLSMRVALAQACLLYTSPSPRDVEESRMPSSA